MTERITFETIKAEGSQLAERIGRLIHEGNVRRIVIRQDDEVVAEFSLTIGVVGALIAPIAAAVGAIAALLTNCRIEVERSEPAPIVLIPPEDEAGTAALDELVEVAEC